MDFIKGLGLAWGNIKICLRITNNICIALSCALSSIHDVHLYSWIEI